MTNEAVAIAAVVMTGVFLSVVAWQLLAIARTAVARGKWTEADVAHELQQLAGRLADLESAVQSPAPPPPGQL